jgi:hypothetical protein
MNKELIIEDSTLAAMPPTKSIQKLKVQIPLGSIESDSGSHLIDVLTIVSVVLVIYVGKILVDKFFRGDK